MSTIPHMQAAPARPKGKASLAQLFAHPFRIFFLSLALLALVMVPLWVLVVTGNLALPLALPAMVWHQHEMLFGFLSAAIAGFLLTAVCVWTQTDRTYGARLGALWGVWVLARILLAVGEALPVWLVQGVNLAFIPLVMLDAGRRIWAVRQQRQYVILLLLGALWLMQIGYVFWHNPIFSQGALVLALALISIVGGRITPAFSANWLRQHGLAVELVRQWPVLDKAVLVSLGLLVLSLISGLSWAIAGVALLAGILMLIRLAGWRGWLLKTEPLLWILHLSLLWVPVSLLLLSGATLFGWPATLWTHAAGTGAIGCLILGVIARVALGHTGRPLQLPVGMVLAFVAVHLSAVFRVITAAGAFPWQAGIWLSALLWMFAFGVFLWQYWGVLATPRVDGKEG